eukprot:CAMPEP_0170457202 /NCGR_PEP_ID=MMETSP0123-20130129/4576_1 /TAXON_ID=182087 /ORGANISM="Favella ehrenbergii, Strain Fehren 1" /LENGTH=184 /DNA_ID=CAMNT_0010720923 /DNA_START=394 /DNA_END=947 /DNA_ORIENTATION=+
MTTPAVARSDGELVADGLALLNRLEVVVEEVDVEAGLEDGRQRLRPAEEALHLVAVDPIQNVEEAIEAEAGNVVTGEVFNNTHLVQHDDLGDEGDGLEPERVAPHEGPGAPARIQDHSQHQSHRKESPVRELVTERVISRAKRYLILHQVDEEGGGTNEENLHEGVVDRDEVEEKIAVADHEHQ